MSASMSQSFTALQPSQLLPHLAAVSDARSCQVQGGSLHGIECGRAHGVHRSPGSIRLPSSSATRRPRLRSLRQNSDQLAREMATARSRPIKAASGTLGHTRQNDARWSTGSSPRSAGRLRPTARSSRASYASPTGRAFGAGRLARCGRYRGLPPCRRPTVH